MHFAEAKSVVAFRPQLLALLGDAYGRVGRLDDALATLNQALDLALELGQRGNEPRTLYLLANVHGHARSGSENQARQIHQRAMMLAHELRMRPLEAKCRLALGRSARKASENLDACDQLTVAATMFRDMGMQAWVEKTESALKAL